MGGGDFGKGGSIWKNHLGLAVLLLVFSALLPGNIKKDREVCYLSKPPSHLPNPVYNTNPVQDGEWTVSEDGWDKVEALQYVHKTFFLFFKGLRHCWPEFITKSSQIGITNEISNGIN